MSSNTNPQLIQAANEFVNQAFYGTLLREFRAAQHNPYFDNGPGGKIFMEQLDTEIIRRMSQRESSPLAQALIDQLGSNEALSGKLKAETTAARYENVSVNQQRWLHD